MTPVHHEINYVEITVTDMVAARYFHDTAFGWRFIDYALSRWGTSRHLTVT